MPHPHQSMLDELDYAIKHFVPTLPQEIKNEAKQVLTDLQADEEADMQMMKKAFYEVGVKEYPHRKAYEELTSADAEQQMKDMVLEHVDDTVRAMIEPHLKAGVSLRELVSSDIFEEELDAKQRYQVQDGILVAQSKLADALKEEVSEHGETYKKLLEKWQQRADEIQEKINKLEALGQGGTENQQAEIKSKVTRLREGFIITEQDPTLEEVEQEIAYWTETFAEEE